MKTTLTATTSAQSVLASSIVTSPIWEQVIVIQNLGSNPVYFTKNDTATTSCLCLPTQYASCTVPITQSFDYISFITTGGSSAVVLETF